MGMEMGREEDPVSRTNSGNYLIRETDPGGYESVSDGDSTDGSDDTPANSNTNDNLIPVTITTTTTGGEIDSGNDFVDKQKKDITGTGASEPLTGTSADEVFIGGAGRDTLIGNDGNDCFKFNYTSDGVDTINDFSSGDIIDFSSFFDTGGELEGITNPFGTYVEAVLVNEGTINEGTMIQIDFDPSDSLPNKNVVFLEGYTTTMAAADFAF